jgi:tetratricopeptide (TPR) repeat protein
VGRTFSGVFPNSVLLTTEPGGVSSDYLLVGFKGPHRLTLDYADRKRAHVQKSKNVDLRDPRLLFGMILSQNLPQLFGPGKIHTDNHPRLEFTAPKLMYSDGRKARIYQKIHSQRWPSLLPDTLAVIRQVAGNTESQLDLAAYALSLYSPFSGMMNPVHATAEQKKRFYEMVENYCTQNEVDLSIFTDNELVQRCLTTQIEAIEKKIDRLPDRMASYAYLGALYSLEGRPAQALEYFGKASQMGPLSAKIHNNLGTALVKENRVAEGIHHFSEAIRLDPDFKRAHFNWGYVLAQQSRLDEAIGHFSEALRLDPAYAIAYIEMGAALTRQGRSDEAISNYTKLLALKPGHPEAHYYLGLLYSRQNRLDEAIGHFSEVLRVRPGNAAAYNAQGVALFRQGRLDEAAHHFDQALRLKPDFAGAHNNLGIALVRKGMPEDAAGHFKAALRINPDYTGARNNLHKVLALRQK